MNWRERIVCDPEILDGKPTVGGTRISAALLLDRLADGWSVADLRASYPRISDEDLRAVFALASELTARFRHREGS